MPLSSLIRSPRTRPAIPFAPVLLTFTQQLPSRVPSNQLFVPDVRVLLSGRHTFSSKCPSSILVCFSSFERGVHPNTLSSQESQDGRFLHRFATAMQVRTIVGDTCWPVSGSASMFFHLPQQTVAPRVLSPVLVLTFSSHLCGNDTVRRNNRMSLDPRPRLSVYLSIFTLPLYRMLRHQHRYHCVSSNCPRNLAV